MHDVPETCASVAGPDLEFCADFYSFLSAASNAVFSTALSCMKGKHNSYMQNSYPSLGHGVDFTENICTPRKTALRLVT